MRRFGQLDKNKSSWKRRRRRGRHLIEAGDNPITNAELVAVNSDGLAAPTVVEKKVQPKKVLTEAMHIVIYEPEVLEVDGQLLSHNIWVDGHRTSVRLEAVMWAALTWIANQENLTINGLVSMVARHRHPSATLTATLRAFLLAYYKAIAPKTLEAPLLKGNTGSVEKKDDRKEKGE